MTDVASLPAALTALVGRLRDGDWNMRTPEELAEAVADAIMEALAARSPAPSAGVGDDAIKAAAMRCARRAYGFWRGGDNGSGEALQYFDGGYAGRERDAAMYEAEIRAALQHPAAPSAPDLDAVVSRFLCWRLPDDFAPDNGISFTPISNPAWTHDTWPIGTNLLTAVQARAMLEYVLNMPAGAPRAQQPLDETANNAGVATGSRNVSPSESVTPGSPPASLSSVPPSVAGDAGELPLEDRVEFALRDAGFDYDEAFRISRLATAEQPIDRARFRAAPCYLCGYNGEGYYQPNTHSCAAKYHATAEQPGSAVQGEANTGDGSHG